MHFCVNVFDRFGIKGDLCWWQVLAKGAEEANKTANLTLENCRQAMGFTPKYAARQ